jgi:hypothetical protein
MRLSILILFIFICTSIVFPVKLATFPELQKPNSIIIDKDQIFINDGPTIYIYSLKDCSLQKKFGKKGEGPQEFKISPSMFGGGVTIDVQPDYLLIGSIGRLSFFTREGVYKSERAVTSFWDVKALGKQYVMLKAENDKKIAFFTLNLYDQDFKTRKEISRPMICTLGEKVDPVAFFRFTSLCIYDNKIYVVTYKEKENLSCMI